MTSRDGALDDSTNDEQPRSAEAAVGRSESEIDVENHKVAGQIKMEQYRSLRGEILDKIKQMHLIELYAIVAVSAYYAWLFNRCLPPILGESVPLGTWALYFGRATPWLMPVFIPLFGWWRNWKYAESIRRLAKYLRCIEAQFAREGLAIGPRNGWETYNDEERKERHANKLLRVLDIFVLFWLTMILVILGMTLIGIWVGGKTCTAPAL